MGIDWVLTLSGNNNFVIVMDWKQLLSYERERQSTKDNNREKFDARTPIESDFGRVIFSPACRRLHDKTQVLPLTTDDNIHSRLTHSMEVMNIGLSFALSLSKSKEFKEKSGLTEEQILHDLSSALRTACLVHDIGNPPFGHFGEEAIQIYFKSLFSKIAKISTHNLKSGDKPDDSMTLLLYNYFYEKAKYEYAKQGKGDLDKQDDLTQKREICEIYERETDFLKHPYDFTEFDGNAQGFRVISRLQFAGDLNGLNLTFASLGAYLKYPNPGPKQKEGGIAVHKHGIFNTEESLLRKVADTCGMNINGKIVRHPLAFLMEAADSICYLVMDIEDGISKKWFTVSNVCEEILKSIGDYENEKNKAFVSKIQALRDNNQLISYKRLIHLRMILMNYLIELAETNFIEKLDLIDSGEYSKELIEDDENGIAKILGGFCKKKILCQREIISLELAGQATINGLLDAYLKILFSEHKSVRNRGKEMISQSILATVVYEHFDSLSQPFDIVNLDKLDVIELTMEEKFRLLRDYISGMTDKFALNHNKKLSGQQIY